MKTITKFNLRFSSLAVIALAVLPPLSAQSANLVQDGSFEGTPRTTCLGQSFGAWAVERGAVDFTDDFIAADGRNSVDLSGSFFCSLTLDGSIYQDLPTTPGALYRLRFALAGNVDSDPQIKEMQLRWGDSDVATLFFDTAGRSRSNMGWTYYEYLLSATFATTRLTFRTPILTGFGPVIDDVSVEPVVTHLAIRCSQMELCWNSVTNRNYQVQYRSSLTTNMWVDLGSPIGGNGTTNCITDAVTTGQPQRFYRIQELP